MPEKKFCFTITRLFLSIYRYVVDIDVDVSIQSEQSMTSLETFFIRSVV